MRWLRRVRQQLGAVHREERGNNTVLGIGYIVLLLLLIAVVVFVTEVNIAARQLWSTTDSAAQAAADVGGTEEQAAGESPQGQQDLTVDVAQLRSRVDDFLALSGAYQRHRGLRVESVTVDAGQQTVEVVLSAEAAGPILHTLLPAGVPVSTESSARLVLTR